MLHSSMHKVLIAVCLKSQSCLILLNTLFQFSVLFRGQSQKVTIHSPRRLAIQIAAGSIVKISRKDRPDTLFRTCQSQIRKASTVCRILRCCFILLLLVLRSLIVRLRVRVRVFPPDISEIITRQWSCFRSIAVCCITWCIA